MEATAAPATSVRASGVVLEAKESAGAPFRPHDGALRPPKSRRPQLMKEWKNDHYLRREA